MKDIVTAVVTDPKAPQYKLWFQHCKMELDNITGPDPSDRNSLTWPFTAESMSLNRHGTLHGGVAVKLIDTFSSLHLSGLIDSTAHVSVNLNVSFLKAVPGGRRVLLKTYVVKHGRSMAFLEARIVDAADPSMVYVTATHSKAVLARTQAKM